MLIDCILVGMAMEALLLRYLARRHHLSLRWAEILSALLPGVFLLLAVRGALAGHPVLVVFPLLGALAAHLEDLRRRLRAGGRGMPAQAPVPAHPSHFRAST